MKKEYQSIGAQLVNLQKNKHIERETIPLKCFYEKTYLDLVTPYTDLIATGRDAQGKHQYPSSADFEEYLEFNRIDSEICYFLHVLIGAFEKMVRNFLMHVYCAKMKAAGDKQTKDYSWTKEYVCGKQVFDLLKLTATGRGSTRTFPRRTQPARDQRDGDGRQGVIQGVPQPMKDRALLPGDEDMPGGEAGIRVRPEHHIRALPRHLLRADRDEAARAQGVRRRAARRVALRFHHPRVQRHRDARRQLRQQRDRDADLPGRKGKGGAIQTGQRIPVEKDLTNLFKMEF